MSQDNHVTGTNGGFDAESFITALKAKLSDIPFGMEDLSVLDIAEKLGPWLSTARADDVFVFIRTIEDGIIEVREHGGEDMLHIWTALVVLKAVLKGQHSFLTDARQA